MRYKNTSNAMIRIFVNGKVRELGAQCSFEAPPNEDWGNGHHIPACVVEVSKPKATTLATTVQETRKATTTTTTPAATVQETRKATTTTPTPYKRKARKSRTIKQTTHKE